MACRAKGKGKGRGRDEGTLTKQSKLGGGQDGGPVQMDVDHTSECGQDGQELGGTSGLRFRRNMHEVLQLRDDGKTSRWLVERRAKARAEAEMKAPQQSRANSGEDRTVGPYRWTWTTRVNVDRTDRSWVEQVD